MNTLGTMAVLEYWRTKKCKLIYAASSTKSDATKTADGIAGRDLSPYTWAKATNVTLVENYGRWYSLPYAIVYFYNVYGPRERSWGNYGTVIETFRQNFLAKRVHEVNSPCTQTRSFTHVADTIDAIVLVAEKSEGDGHNISSNEVHSIIEVVEMFGGEIVMKPQTKTSRSSGTDDTSKVESLGWKPTRSLKEYIDTAKKDL